MGRPRILDKAIMTKLAKKLGKPDLFAVNKLVSSRASQHGIAAESALVVLAKQNGIGTSTYYRRLDPAKQAEVRSLLTSSVPITKSPDHIPIVKGGKRSVVASPRRVLKDLIGYLIEDEKLLGRCRPALIGTSNFDIAINQATLVLEDRIRKKSEAPGKMSGHDLIGYSFNQDISKTLLRVASNDPDDQKGFTEILRGIVAAFRNKTHHHLIESFSRKDAIRVCGFVDALIRVVDTSVKIR